MLKNFLLSTIVFLTLGSVRFVAKAQSFPHQIRVAAVVHVQGLNDLSSPDGNDWFGTIGEGRRLELLQLGLENPPPGLDIQYMCHMQDLGDYPTGGAWLDGSEIISRGNELAGQPCGSRAQKRRLEGFAVRLIGENAGLYDVRYSCHIQDKGNLTGENGSYCGTRHEGRRMEAIRVHVTHVDAG